MEGIGPHRFWGASPSVDLFTEYTKCLPSPSCASELNILVVGSGDVRHALRTVSSLRRQSKLPKSVNIFLYDTPVEVIARHMLLLSIICDWEEPIRNRANTFLEVFGNALVQERTNKYIAKLGRDLVHFVCDDKGSLERLVDLSHLKNRDRDALEKIFKSWDEKVVFDMKGLREKRLRILYNQRYDDRKGLVDWDYQQGLKGHASIIHYKQYRHWRETGVAFEFGDQTYTMANKSLQSYAKGKEQGVSRMRLGFWSDVQIGPYISFGVDCQMPNQYARDLFKIIGKGTGTEQHRHTAVHIAVYNLLCYLHEIERNEVYKMTKAEDIFSGLGDHQKGSTNKEFAMTCAKNILQLKDLVNVSVITGDDFNSTFRDKKKYNGFFDMVWLSNHHGHLVTKNEVFDSILNQKEHVVLVETARNMVMLKGDKKDEYKKKIVALAKAEGYDVGTGENQEEFITFVRKKKQS